MNQLVPLLNVEDVSASIAFYQAALHATVENEWSLEGSVRWARFAFAGGAMMLNTPELASSAERRTRADFDDVVLYVMCEDATARRAELAARGLPVGEMKHEDYGNDEFALRDPDGYAIRFSSARG